jgi:hypothetical protein
MTGFPRIDFLGFVAHILAEPDLACHSGDPDFATMIGQPCWSVIPITFLAKTAV